MVPTKQLTFGHVVPVSALSGLGMDQLKAVIRHSLDQHAATAEESSHQDRLQVLRKTASMPVWGNSSAL